MNIMTAEDKIKSSEYILEKMKKQGFDKNFGFELSSFLSSTGSVFYHLLYDFVKVFSLSLKKKDRLNPKKFRDLAEGNEKALEFIEWYDKEFEKIKKDDGFNFFIKRRHLDTHQEMGQDTLVATITIENTAVSWTTTDMGGYEISGSGHHYELSEKPGEDPIAWCEKYLERIKKMVNDSEGKKNS